MSLKPFGITIFILALLLLAAKVIPFGFLNSQEVFIHNAEFEVPDFKSLDKFEIDENLKPAFFTRVHRLRRGVGTVFAIRKAHPGSLGDGSENFEKITVWVAKPKVGLFKFEDKLAIRGFYSRGESVLPRTQCGSEILTGDFEIVAISANTISLKMKAQIGCFMMTGEKQQDVFIEVADRFKELKWNDLTLKKL